MSTAFWHGFVSTDWNTGVQQDGSSNWGTLAPGAPGATPTAVPTDTADFPTNAIRFDVTFSQNTTIATLLFDPGVPTYNFDLALNPFSLTITGDGIVNPFGSAPFFLLPFAAQAVASEVLGPVLTFQNKSSAGNAVIEPYTAGQGVGGRLVFADASTAGNATIKNVDTLFKDHSNAGSAVIANLVSGITTFDDFSSAQFVTITNTGQGVTRFVGGSFGGHASISNIDLGITIFTTDDPTSQDRARAENASITNAGGSTFFTEGTSAGHATIINLGSTGPGNPGVTTFDDRALAGDAVITNDGGTTFFGSETSAVLATIINKNGGYTQFEADSTADEAEITTLNGSFTKFIGQSNGGSSVLTVEDGGSLSFADQSSAGSATIVDKTGGTVDLSGLADAGMAAGSIEGNGRIQLGHAILVVGGNDQSTAMGGVIEDGGAEGGVGGGLVKMGAGTLTLTGADTYTGPTIIIDGTLEIAAGGSLKSSIGFQQAFTLGSDVFLRAGDAATLKLDLPGSYSGVIDGFHSGAQVDFTFRSLTAGDHLSWLANGNNGGGTLSYLDSGDAPVGSLTLTGWHSSKEFSIKGDGAGGVLIVTDQISGTSNNDIFQAQGAHHVFYGNGGHDTIVLAGPKADYSIASNSDGTFTISDGGLHGDGTNVVFGIERLAFSEANMFVENPDNANIARLYSAALGRLPDPVGLFGWEDLYANAVPASAKDQGVYVALAQADLGGGISIAGGFTHSTEFMNKYGALDNAGFITLLYNNVLDRAPDAAGLAGWVNAMQQGGLSREWVLVGFAESAENIAKTAADWLIQI